MEGKFFFMNIIYIFGIGLSLAALIKGTSIIKKILFEIFKKKDFVIERSLLWT